MAVDFLFFVLHFGEFCKSDVAVVSIGTGVGEEVACGTLLVVLVIQFYTVFSFVYYFIFFFSSSSDLFSILCSPPLIPIFCLAVGALGFLFSLKVPFPPSPPSLLCMFSGGLELLDLAGYAYDNVSCYKVP